MKQPYGVFAEASGEVRLIHTGSVRFSRANRFALRVIGQNVFFSHYTTDKQLVDVGLSTERLVTTYSPTGERHKPKHLEIPDWSKRSFGKSDIVREIEFAARKLEAKPDTRKRRKPRRRNLDDLDYSAVDPQTGESLNDVLVDMHRERLARGHRDA